MTTINPTPTVAIWNLLNQLDDEAFLRRTTVTPGHVDRTLIGVAMATSIVSEHITAAGARYAEYVDAAVIERCLVALEYEATVRRRGSVPGSLDRTLIGLMLATSIVAEHLRIAEPEPDNFPIF